jgi:signal peptidase II
LPQENYSDPNGRVEMMFYGMVLILLLLDLAIKRWMEARFHLGETMTVIPDWLSWTLIYNKGASFGIFSNYTSVLAAISFIAILFIVYSYRYTKPKTIVVQLGYALLLAGAIGNWVERVWQGYVTDFIAFRWWPGIFNLADMEIRGGMLVLIVLFFTKRMEILRKEV